MKAAQRTRILVEGNERLLSQLSRQIEQQYKVRVEKPATKGLILTKARDSVSMQPFYVGEVFITECTVSIGQVYGFGAVMGEEPERAFQLAVVDAAFRAALPETASWHRLLLEEEQRIREKHEREHALIMQTKVNFDAEEESDGGR